MPRKYTKKPVEGKAEANKEISELVRKQPTLLDCYCCGRKLGDNVCRKGSRNQYRFCSVECCNEDNLPHDSE